MSVVVRKAERGDCEAILRLKKELAVHSKMGHLPIKLSARDLERDGFDSSPPCFQCLVAERRSEGQGGQESRLVIGYALYYVIYPVWEGKGLLLEDLCVSSEFRGTGAGKLLLQELGKIGVEGNYSRITLECLDWNPTVKFYVRNGGLDVTAAEGWHLFRFGQAEVKSLAEGLK